MLPHSRDGLAARAVNLDDRPDPAAGGCALESPALVGLFPQTAKLKTIAVLWRGQGGAEATRTPPCGKRTAVPPPG